MKFNYKDRGRRNVLKTVYSIPNQKELVSYIKGNHYAVSADGDNVYLVKGKKNTVSYPCILIPPIRTNKPSECKKRMIFNDNILLGYDLCNHRTVSFGADRNGIRMMEDVISIVGELKVLVVSDWSSIDKKFFDDVEYCIVLNGEGSDAYSDFGKCPKMVSDMDALKTGMTNDDKEKPSFDWKYKCVAISFPIGSFNIGTNDECVDLEGLSKCTNALKDVCSKIRKKYKK